MRDGKVEQIGTPEEIYARPASLFVADFVGRVSVLRGRVVERVGGYATVETLSHRFRVETARCPADEVLVLLRPEAVRVDDATMQGIAGVVEEVEYCGDRIEYRVRVGGAIIVAVESALGRSVRIAEGSRVGLRLIEEALHFLPVGETEPEAQRRDGP